MKWTEEKIEFMKDIIPGKSESEIRELFNNKFGVVLTEGQIGNFKSRFHIKSGTHGGRFYKGMTPANKGKKMSADMYKKCQATMFKKGQLPANHKEVGSERVNIYGYVEIKVAEPNKWMLKHRYVYGDIPKGYVLMFKDGNKLNCSKDNLILISRKDQVRFNQKRRGRLDPNLRETAIYLTMLEEQDRERRQNELSQM